MIFLVPVLYRDFVPEFLYMYNIEKVNIIITYLIKLYVCHPVLFIIFIYKYI